MMYKQYLHKDLHGHYIYCLQSGKEVFKVAETGDDEHIAMHHLRWSHVSFEVDDGKEIDPNNLPVFYLDGEEGTTPDREENYAYARQYVSALSGAFQDRRLTMIHLCDTHIAFDVATFAKNGTQKDYTIVILKGLPDWAKVVVDLEPMVGEEDALYREPDRYVIRNKAASGEPMRLVVEDYRNGGLIRSRELGTDDKGDFEIITEMTDAEAEDAMECSAPQGADG